MDLRIRDAHRDDAAALAALIGQLGYPSSPEAVARRVDRLRASESDRLVVAETGGEVIGLAARRIGFDETGKRFAKWLTAA